MNSWRARWWMFALITGVPIAHALATASLPNTPEAMLLFHGSAALLDCLLLVIVPKLLGGQLRDHTQWLLVASACGNFAGWVLYMKYAPPIYYNWSMWLLTIIQWVRLVIPDHHADNPWFDLVRHRDRVGSGHNP